MEQTSNESGSAVVRLGQRDLAVRITPRAARQLQCRHEPLYVEMELYFSCLIRKRVIVSETPRPGRDSASLDDRAVISFRPVMTRHCSVHAVEGEPPLEDFPLVEAARFTPRWLSLDYRRGAWSGDFGFGQHCS